MQVSEESRGDRAMASAVRFLVAPRMLALVLLMPCLSTVSEPRANIRPAAWSAKPFSVLPFLIFSTSMKIRCNPRHITGILKSFLFRSLIAAIACYRD